MVTDLVKSIASHMIGKPEGALFNTLGFPHRKPTLRAGTGDRRKPDAKKCLRYINRRPHCQWRYISGSITA
jgi:hypothetical protein